MRGKRPRPILDPLVHRAVIAEQGAQRQAQKLDRSSPEAQARRTALSGLVGRHGLGHGRRALFAGLLGVNASTVGDDLAVLEELGDVVVLQALLSEQRGKLRRSGTPRPPTVKPQRTVVIEVEYELVN